MAATVPHHNTGVFSTIRVVGGLLPPDLLSRIAAGTELPGLAADDFGLELGVTPKEAANRAWAVLVGAWRGYQDAVARLPDDDKRATGLTREKWLLVVMRELGFGKVPVTGPGGITVGDRPFPVSHLAAAGTARVPAHLLGRGIDLDRRNAGVAGAADRAPHAMVQELLNRSDEYLWALTANAHVIRLLRDSSTLVGPSFVEFDLEAMFEGEVFADFVVMFLTCHASRFEPRGAHGGAADCWLEAWRDFAAETGTRALGALREGVQKALEALGTGFIRHPDNAALRNQLFGAAPTLTPHDYHRGLLRLAYRLLFTFVAEDRALLLDPEASATAKQRYDQWFSTARLRRVASKRHGTKHADSWRSLIFVLDALGTEGGQPELALPGLGGIFDNGPLDTTAGLELANDALFAALRHLSVIRTSNGPSRVVDYRHLGAEELGGIYESLLELVPEVRSDDRSFRLTNVAGNERKTTGAYYTPASLIDCLLDSALDPLLDEAEQEKDPEAALLALTVCDPACGSGHFLVAAARRIAHRVARIRAAAEGAEPSNDDMQTALHDVIGRCIYGVDLNEMAAELAKVSLWLEALQPGRPLNFLDAHIKVGNALLGTTPALLRDGIPDDAYVALVGDDKPTVKSHKQRNKSERAGQGTLLGTHHIAVDNTALRDAFAAVGTNTASLADIHIATARLREFERSPELRQARTVADAWCAAFTHPKSAGAPAVTTGLLNQWLALTSDGWAGDGPSDDAHAVVQTESARHRFFHWHLEFPDVFRVSSGGAASAQGWTGGFSCVLGNPPWERIKLQEQEFFAARDPRIAAAPNASARKKLIAALNTEDPALFQSFEEAKRQAEAESHLVRSSGRFPLCGRGDVNTYAVFAETDRNLIGPAGRTGFIVPTGIATDATTQHFFRSLVEARALVSLYDFENRKQIFEGIDSRIKFCLLTIAGTEADIDAADFAFFALDPIDLTKPDARFALTPEEIKLINPNTGTCPVFRSRHDAEIAISIYKRLPVLIRHGDPQGNPWDVSLKAMFHMSNDSVLFREYAQLDAEGWTLGGNVFERNGDQMLPLYEGKMIHHFDHRWATYGPDGDSRDTSDTERQSRDFAPLPRYWVSSADVAKAAVGWPGSWFCGFRDITNSTNERTMISAVLPFTATGNNLPVAVSPRPEIAFLAAVWSSVPFDFVARLSVGGTHMNFFIAEQLPVPLPGSFSERCSWSSSSLGDWMAPRVLELTFTSATLKAFARDLGDNGAHFLWNEDRRELIRAELDAAFSHIYGLERKQLDYILGTFPIVNRKDVERRGEERTRRLVLENYDAIAEAIETRKPFVSKLTPAPGEGPRHAALAQS